MISYYEDYTKEEFIKFLQECKCDYDLIVRFENLPIQIIKSDILYKLNIIVTWHGNNETYYDFEINYYDVLNFVFLFPYKIYSNIKQSIKYLEDEINKL